MKLRMVAVAGRPFFNQRALYVRRLNSQKPVLGTNRRPTTNNPQILVT